MGHRTPGRERTLYPRRFDYARPSSLTEAVEMLHRNPERAKVLAGGQSLIPLMKLRLASPALIVDINRIPGLGYVREREGTLCIGALARHRDLHESDTVRRRYGALWDAAASLGDPQVRNLGTVAGSLAHADPASDWGAALLAFESEVVATGPNGSRRIPLDRFFVDTFSTALAPDEILSEIRVPRPGPGGGSAYMKLKRKTGDFATVGAAVALEVRGKGPVQGIRIALAAVGATPVRAREAEESLRGARPSPDAVTAAARLAGTAGQPAADLRGSEAYKRAMVEAYTRRALDLALERARR